LNNNNNNNNNKFNSFNYYQSQNISSLSQNNLFSSFKIKDDNNSGNNKTQSPSKSISLSKILSLRFQSETFLEEFLTKFNQDNNLKLIKNSKKLQ